MTANDVEIPEPLRALIEASDHEAEQFWADADQQAEALRAFLATGTARDASERFDLARSRPEFVDVCPLGDPCLVVEWRDLHRVAVLRAIGLATAGDAADASLLLRDLIRMDVAHLDSARGAFSFLVARANLQEALTQADRLALRLGQRERSAATSAALTELAQVVRAVDIEAINLQRVVITEYLFHVRALERLEGGDAELLDRVDSPRAIGWAFDRGQTLHSLNERFEARYQAAAAHDTAAALGASEDSPKQQFMWWLRNPVGKLYLDATIIDSDWKIDANLEELGRTQTRLLARPVLAQL
ncbi:hypothetical protein [Enhygromyxa salina]|uniref:hypothetical protein n=1 Tax=Enhygromyxa salina TaxID=215803 RepID=UPI000A4E6F7F|nr:hypothetical protein [Enhygromyxa salina]